MGARHASLATIVLSLIVRLAFDEVACSLGRRTIRDALARTLTLGVVRVADPERGSISRFAAQRIIHAYQPPTAH